MNGWLKNGGLDVGCIASGKKRTDAAQSTACCIHVVVGFAVRENGMLLPPSSCLTTPLPAGRKVYRFGRSHVYSYLIGRYNRSIRSNRSYETKGIIVLL